MKIEDRVHPGHILTKRKNIYEELMFGGYDAIMSLLKCFTYEKGSYRQKNQIILTACIFERLACPVYAGRDGIVKKLPESKYHSAIFEAFAETPGEIYDRIGKYNISPEEAEHIFKIVCQIADLVCPMMACATERAFASEYAYAIEYVILHDGDLPKPDITLLFPSNYPDYHYQEGIAGEMRRCYVT